MSNFMHDWGSLILTAVLVGVTAWYAWMTKSLAKSSTESALAARDAAESARRSVALQEAGTLVELSLALATVAIEPQQPKEKRRYASLIELKNGGVSLVIHKVVLAEGKGGRLIASEGERQVAVKNEILSPYGEIALPLQLHYGESVALQSVEPETHESTLWTYLRVEVHFSVGNSGESVSVRTVRYPSADG